MKQVIRLDLVGQKKQEKKLNPIELTHRMVDVGWRGNKLSVDELIGLSYLGKCIEDGDMFMAKTDKGVINIFKGHLNDGVY